MNRFLFVLVFLYCAVTFSFGQQPPISICTDLLKSGIYDRNSVYTSSDQYTAYRNALASYDFQSYADYSSTAASLGFDIPIADMLIGVDASAKVDNAHFQQIFHSFKSSNWGRGSLNILKRKSHPDAWVFRYYAEENGRRVYKKVNIGSVIEFPKRKDAEKQVAQLRVNINEGAVFAPMNLEQLASHFKLVELPLKSHSTSESYKNFLDTHIVPRWGRYALSSIKSVEVEAWLRSLKRKDGKPASPATGAKIRNVMSALYSHAIRHAWASRNPITPVRTSSKRLRTPDILTPQEFQALLNELPQRERAMVMLAGSTGLRRGEMIALRWSDVDFHGELINVTRSIWRNVEGPTKTEASQKPVPVPPQVLEQLKKWRAMTEYRSEDEFLFPSILKNGEQPLQPEMILRRHIRPALKRLMIVKRIGWHSFRHGLATLLRQQGVDVKIAQELLRHANSRITLDIYQQAMSNEKRFAQGLAFKGLMGTSMFNTLQHPNKEEKEETVSVGC